MKGGLETDEHICSQHRICSSPVLAGAAAQADLSRRPESTLRFVTNAD